jgi:hypothetical protein
MPTSLIITSDLHQSIGKWRDLVRVVNRTSKERKRPKGPESTFPGGEPQPRIEKDHRRQAARRRDRPEGVYGLVRAVALLGR